MKRIPGIALLLILGVSGPAMAGIGEGHYEVVFDYGQTEIDSDAVLEASDSLALRGGYHLTDLFQIEGQYASASDDSDVLGTPVDATVRLVMVNGVFNFHPRQDIVPYVLAGIGMANVDVEVAGLSADDDSLAYQVGAGSRFFFGKSKRVAFRVDLSLVNEETFDDSSTHTTFAGGFTWRLGGGT